MAPAQRPALPWFPLDVLRALSQRVVHLEAQTAAGEKIEVAAVADDPDRLQDESEEPIIYDPQNPDRAVALDELPGPPVIDEQDNLVSRYPGLTPFYLTIPVATLFGPSVYIRWDALS